MVVATNGTSSSGRKLVPGIFAPLPTMFTKGTEELDLEPFKTHVVRMAKAGVYPLVCGSMGEAHHLDREERVTLIKAVREALDSEGFESIPIIAGTGVGSTRSTIAITKEAAAAGADFSIVIPSGYYAGAFDRATLKQFFKEVSEASPIPVMIYNYPGASGGIDMDSDLIEEMAKDLPNTCGVKLTCGNVGKLVRITATTSVPSFTKTNPRKNPNAPFLVLGGFADFIFPTVYSNAHGAITGLANFAPLTLRHLWDLSANTVANPTEASKTTVQELQGIVARADRTIALAGIPGTKWLLNKTKGYGGSTRLPLLPFADAAGEKLWAHPHVVDIVRVEKLLEAGGSFTGTTYSNGA